MKFLKFFFIIPIIIFFTSCLNTDYLNKNTPENYKTISSNEIFDFLGSKLSFPNFKSLNENELLDIYAIDPKLLIDYVANIPNDNISGKEISIFRLKNIENVTEVILGIERRVNILKQEFSNHKQSEYDLIKNPYIKTFNNYVVFALYSDIDSIEKILNSILN